MGDGYAAVPAVGATALRPVLGGRGAVVWAKAQAPGTGEAPVWRSCFLAQVGILSDFSCRGNAWPHRGLWHLFKILACSTQIDQWFEIAMIKIATTNDL